MGKYVQFIAVACGCVLTNDWGRVTESYTLTSKNLMKKYILRTLFLV